jgi:hypothetical protein
MREEHGLLLWLRNNLDLEFYSRRDNRAFVAWQDILIDWRAAFSVIQEILEISWPCDFEIASKAIDEIVTPSLRHFDIKVGGGQHKWVVDTYAALRKRISDPHSDSATKALDRTLRQFNTASTLFGPVLGDMELKTTESQALHERSQFESQQMRVALNEAENLRAATIVERDRLEARVNRLGLLMSTLQLEINAAVEAL